MMLWYCCKICGRSYQEPKKLINHKREHPDEWKRYKRERWKLKRARHFSSSSSMASASTLDGSMIFGVMNPEQDLQDLDIDLNLDINEQDQDQENNNNSSIVNPNDDDDNNNDGSHNQSLINSTTDNNHTNNNNNEEIISSSSAGALTFHPLSPPLSPKDNEWNYNNSTNENDDVDNDENFMESRTVSISVPTIRDNNNISGPSSSSNSFNSHSIPTEVEMEVESRKIILHVCEIQSCQKMFPLRIKLNKHKQAVHGVFYKNNNNKNNNINKNNEQSTIIENKQDNNEEDGEEAEAEEIPSQQFCCQYCEKSYTSDIAFRAHVKLHMKHKDKSGKPRTGTTSRRRTTANAKSSETLSFRTSRQWALLEKKSHPENSTTTTTTTTNIANTNQKENDNNNTSDNNNANKISPGMKRTSRNRRKVKSKKRKIVNENENVSGSSKLLRSSNTSSNNNSPRKRKKKTTPKDSSSSSINSPIKGIGRMAVTPVSSSSSHHKSKFRTPKSPLSNLNSRLRSRVGNGQVQGQGPKTPKSHKANGNIGFCLRSARKWAVDFSTPAAQQKRQRLRDEITQTKGQKKRESGHPFIQKEVLGNGKPRHVCIICKLDFRYSNEAKQHLKSHKEHLKAFQCLLCDRYFAEKGSLTRHQKRTHDLAKDGDQLLIHRPNKKSKSKTEEMKMDNESQSLMKESSASVNNVNATKPPRNYTKKKVFKCELCHLPFHDFKLRYLHQQTMHPSSQTNQQGMIA